MLLSNGKITAGFKSVMPIIIGTFLEEGFYGVDGYLAGSRVELMPAQFDRELDAQIAASRLELFRKLDDPTRRAVRA